MATAIEELLKHHKAKEEQEKLKQAEAEKREAEKEAARLAAERAREEQMTALQQQHSAAIINALAEMVSGACKALSAIAAANDDVGCLCLILPPCSSRLRKYDKNKWKRKRRRSSTPRRPLKHSLLH